MTMTKFVTVVLAVAVVIVGSASAIAGGWKTGNWEPPKKMSAKVKAVSLNADWGTASVAPAAPVVVAAGCRGSMAQHAQPAQRVGCNGGGWFLGKFLMANRQARASARMGNAHALMSSGHS